MSGGAISDLQLAFQNNYPDCTFTNNSGFNAYVLGDCGIILSNYHATSGKFHDYIVNSKTHKVKGSTAAPITFGKLSGTFGPLTLYNGTIIDGVVTVPKQTIVILVDDDPATTTTTTTTTTTKSWGLNFGTIASSAIQ